MSGEGEWIHPPNLSPEAAAELQKLIRMFPEKTFEDVQRIRDLEKIPVSIFPDRPMPRSAFVGPPFYAQCVNCKIRFTLDYLPKFCLWCHASWMVGANGGTK